MTKRILLLFVILAALLTACTGTSSTPSADKTQVTEPTAEKSPMANTALGGFVADMELGELTAAEIETLMFMREEEKLARDVYTAFYEQWELNIFNNIASSEQTHMDAMAMLIERYSLEDPINAEPGVFSNPTLQELYDQLVAQGSQSLGAALKVGATIEEIDILDLQAGVAETDNDDLKVVYNTLMRGSRNHLRSFTKVLKNQTREVYEPQYMEPEAYLEIVNSPMENGHGGEGGPGEHEPGSGNGNGNGNGRGQGG